MKTKTDFLFCVPTSCIILLLVSAIILLLISALIYVAAIGQGIKSYESSQVNHVVEGKVFYGIFLPNPGLNKGDIMQCEITKANRVTLKADCMWLRTDFPTEAPKTTPYP